MKCDLCLKKQGFRNWLEMQTIVAVGGQLAVACSSCRMALEEKLALTDTYGFVWSIQADGTLTCTHTSKEEEKKNNEL